MTNETQNKFAAILAQAKLDASKKTVLKSAPVKPTPTPTPTPTPIEPVKIEQPIIITQTVKDIDSRPELSTVTFNDIIKEVTQPIEQPAIDLQIVDYNERSFAVIGKGTKREKDKLRALGGAWNAHLKCGQGWIFSKKKLASVKANYPNL